MVPTVTRRLSFPLPLVSCSLSWAGAEDGLDDRVSSQAPGSHYLFREWSSFMGRGVWLVG